MSDLLVVGEEGVQTVTGLEPFMMSVNSMDIEVFIIPTRDGGVAIEANVLTDGARSGVSVCTTLSRESVEALRQERLLSLFMQAVTEQVDFWEESLRQNFPNP